MKPKRPRRRLEQLDHPAEHELSVELLKAAYNEGRRALEQQYSALNNIRQRCVQFMAFVGSATAFLVGSAISAKPDRNGIFFASLGIATLVSLMSLGFLFLILLSLTRRPDGDDKGSGGRLSSTLHYWMVWKWGRAQWNFSVEPGVLISDWITPKIGASGESDFYRDLALHSQDQLDENDFYMTQIYRWYNWFVIFASLQVIVWAVAAWMFV